MKEKKVWVCVRVTQRLLQHTPREETLCLSDTNDIRFLCRYSACLGGCGEAASQVEGERRGPHAGEALPAEDGPAEPPVPSYTQLTAGSAEVPSEGTSASAWALGV